MERRKVSSGEFHRGISQSSNVPLVHQVMKVLAMDVFRHASLLLVAAIAKDERGGGQCFPREKYSGCDSALVRAAREILLRHVNTVKRPVAVSPLLSCPQVESQVDFIAANE